MTGRPIPPANALPELGLLPVSGYSTEDVLVSPKGDVYSGLADGRVIRVNAKGTTRTVANTGGRPLGLEFLPNGKLLVCDAKLGLFAVDPDNGTAQLIANRYRNKAIPFCNNAAVARDGTIYFTSSTRRHTIENALHDIVENVPTGRLFKRLPDGSIEPMLDGLYFANGVALDPDERFVLVAETGGSAINKVWLKGQKKGKREVFASDLPGYPDNMALGSDGLFWVALAAPSSEDLHKIHRLPFALRWLIARLPNALKPTPEDTICVMAFNGEGDCVHNFAGRHEGFHMPTGVRERNGVVWLGSLERDCIARFTLPNS